MFYDVRKMTKKALVDIVCNELAKAEAIRGNAYKRTVQAGATCAEARNSGLKAAQAYAGTTEFSYSFMLKCKKEEARRALLSEVMKTAHLIKRAGVKWSECLRAAWMRVRRDVTGNQLEVAGAIRSVLIMLDRIRPEAGDMCSLSIVGSRIYRNTFSIDCSREFGAFFRTLADTCFDRAYAAIEDNYNYKDGVYRGVKIKLNALRAWKSMTCPEYREAVLIDRVLRFLRTSCASVMGGGKDAALRWYSNLFDAGLRENGLSY